METPIAEITKKITSHLGALAFASCIFLVVFFLGICAAKESNAQSALISSVPQIDFYGDPLPTGAVARCGSIGLYCGHLTAIAFSSDGCFVVTESAQIGLTLWNAQTGKHKAAMMKKGKAALTSLVFSPDNRFLAGADSLGKLWVWTVAEPTAPPQEINGHKTGIRSIAFSHDGKLLASLQADSPGSGAQGGGKSDPATGGIGGLIRIWEMEANKPLADIEFPKERIRCLAFVGNTGLLAVGSLSGGVWLCDGKTGLGRQKLNDGNGSVKQICSSADGGILSILRDGVQLWDTNSAKLIKVPQGAENAVFCQGLSSNGRYLIVRKNIAILNYDLLTGNEVKRIECQASDLPHLMAVSPDGNWAAIPWHGFFRLWNVQTGNEPFSRHAHMQVVTSARILANGNTLLSFGLDYQARRWELVSGKPLGAVPFTKTDIGIPELSLQADALAICAGAGITLYETSTSKEIGKWKTKCSSMAFSPNGRILAITEELTHAQSGSGTDLLVTTSGCVRMLSDANGMHMKELARQPESVKHLAFSLDGKFLASGGYAIRLWDSASGNLLRTFGKPTINDLPYGVVPFRPLFFTPDGGLVVQEIKSDDDRSVEVVNLWDVSTGVLVRDLLFLHPHRFVGQSPDGRRLALNDTAPDTDRVIIREWPSLKKVCVLQAGHASCVAFSNDPETLVTGCHDGNLLVWNMGAVKGDLQKSLRPLRKDDFELLWRRLGNVWDWGTESVIDVLVASPGSTVAYFQQRLRPISDEHIAKLINELDANQYGVRELAMAELKKLEFAALEPLKKCLSDPRSPEVLTRVKQLLLNYTSHSEEWSRQWNSVVVLEQIGTSEAKQLLEVLAQGSPAAKLTKDASAAIARITGKQSPAPRPPKIGNEVNEPERREKSLRHDPRLQARLTIDQTNPPFAELLTRLQTVTGLQLTTDDALTGHAPELGAVQLRDVPAWTIMELLAQHSMEDGRWDKTPDGYRLSGHSTCLAPSAGFPWLLAGGLLSVVALLAVGTYRWGPGRLGLLRRFSTAS